MDTKAAGVLHSLLLGRLQAARPNALGPRLAQSLLPARSSVSLCPAS
jgi:hypothetical protein